MSKRKLNFSEREVEQLVDCVEAHSSVVLGKSELYTYTYIIYIYIIYSRSYIHCCRSYIHMLFTFSSGSVRLRLAQEAFSLRGRNMVTLLYVP